MHGPRSLLGGMNDFGEVAEQPGILACGLVPSIVCSQPASGKGLLLGASALALHDDLQQQAIFYLFYTPSHKDKPKSVAATPLNDLCVRP